MVKGKAGRDLRLALHRDFMGMFTLAVECRLEPLPLSRFSGNLHQVWTQLQLPSVLDEGGFAPFSLVDLRDPSGSRKGWTWQPAL